MVNELANSLQALLGCIQSDPVLLSKCDPEAVRAAEKTLTKVDIEVLRCFLDISTAHLPESDRQHLDHQPEGRGPFHIVSSDYGWRLLVPEKAMMAESPDALEGFSPAFKALLDHARNLGCYHINLDADACCTDALEYFED